MSEESRFSLRLGLEKLARVGRFFDRKDLRDGKVTKAINALLDLIKIEKYRNSDKTFESYGSVHRAYAHVVADHKLEAFMERNGVTMSNGLIGIGRILGVSPHSKKWNTLRLSGFDHSNVFLKNGKPYLFTTQPYGVTWENLKGMVSFCNEHDLEMEVEYGGSWHFPDDAVLLVFKKAPIKH